MSQQFNVTAEAMLPAPCPWWRRAWLKLRRKPLPTIQPEGTRPFAFEYQDGDVTRRVYIPAARVESINYSGFTDLGYLNADDADPSTRGRE